MPFINIIITAVSGSGNFVRIAPQRPQTDISLQRSLKSVSRSRVTVMYVNKTTFLT